MRRTSMSRFVPFLVMLMMAASATAADRAVLEQKLRSRYKLSSVNAEGDFVVQGTTLVLRKSGFTGGADSRAIALGGMEREPACHDRWAPVAAFSFGSCALCTIFLFAVRISA